MIFTLIALTVSSAGASPAPSLPVDLAAAAQEYDRAQVAGDRKALERLLADDYLLINSRGLSETKAQLIADYTAPGFSLKPFVVEEPAIRQWQDGAVLGGVAALEGTDGGKPYKVRLRFSDVWAKRAGKWQVIYTHASLAQ